MVIRLVPHGNLLFSELLEALTVNADTARNGRGRTGPELDLERYGSCGGATG